MTGPDFKAALDELGIRQNQGPDLFGRSERTLRRYCAGTEIIPMLVVEKIERLLADSRKKAKKS